VASTWPLTPLVRTQLAVAAVWAPIVIGVLFLLPFSSLAMLAGRRVARLFDGPLVLSVAIGLGALVAVRVLPKVWPAASRISPLRLFTACTLGPAFAYVLGIAAHALGMIPAKGSMDLVELLTVLGCSLGGACLSWAVLRQRTEG
jgi:hypothetical protein